MKQISNQKPKKLFVPSLYLNDIRFNYQIKMLVNSTKIIVSDHGALESKEHHVSDSLSKHHTLTLTLQLAFEWSHIHYSNDL